MENFLAIKAAFLSVFKKKDMKMVIRLLTRNYSRKKSGGSFEHIMRRSLVFLRLHVAGVAVEFLVL